MSYSFEEEDGDDWVPLDSQDTRNVHTNPTHIEKNITHHLHHTEKDVVIRSHATIDFNTDNTNITSNSNISHQNSSRSGSNFRSPQVDERKSSNVDTGSDKLNKTLNKIRNRHERNQDMKQNFVNRPLVLFPKLFIYHLVTEFWNSNRTIRIGIVFILAGVCLQLSSFAILFSFSISKLPQLIISSVIIGVISYIALFHLDNPFSNFLRSLSQNKDNESRNNSHPNNQNQKHQHHFLLEVFLTCLEHINGNVLRRICICIFFILPVLMEMRALMLLASLFTECLFKNKKFSWFVARWMTCWVFVLIELVLLVPMHFRIKKEAKLNTRTTSSLNQRTYHFGTIVLELKQQSTLFDVRIHFWIYLYVMALFATTLMMDSDQIHKSIILAAPFLLATGSFLILSCNQTSHQSNDDVDGNTGDGKDNIFLNIIRRALRLSLFEVFQLMGEDIAEDEILQLNILRWMIDLWAGNSTESCSSNFSSSFQANENDIGMRNERTFESMNHQSQSISTPSTSGTSPNISSSGSTSRSTNQSQANVDQNSHYNTAGRGNESSSFTGHASSEPSPYNSSANVNGLKLPSFIQVDERAKPAVQSYKEAVASFPPTRNACIVLAIVQRCPATLLLVCLHLFATHHANCVTIILLPMIILEYMRISGWKSACYSALKDYDDGGNDDAPLCSDLLALPKSMEPMHILLSGDDYSRSNQGSSLQIWSNVQGSVIALEKGLTAVKCVNTANIATDVAMDVWSLAKLGFEVQEKGIHHGVSVLARDLFQFHLEKTMNEGNERTRAFQSSQSGEESYSKTAMNIVNKSKILSKNIGELIEDDENNIFSPIIDGASTLVGKGWLWGKDGKHEDKCNSFNSSNMKEEEVGNQHPKVSKNNFEYNNDRSETQEVIKEESIHSGQSTSFQSDYVDMEYDVGSNRNQDKENEQEGRCEESNDLPGESHHDPSNKKLEKVNDETMDNTANDDNDQSSLQGVEDDREGSHALGAGIAVLAGVIAGGVAFALKNDEAKRDQDTTSSKSNVTIERLDSDNE